MIQTELSVIIPLYNKEMSIVRALQSVAEQEIVPFEVIVVDDGSEDKSADLVRQFQMQEEINLRFIQQENRGVSSARNKGVKEATTHYIAFLDADDEWLPNYTEDLQTLILSEPDADFYSLGYELYKDQKKGIQKVALPDSFSGIVENFVEVYNSGYGIIHSSTVCFKRDFFWKIGGFPDGKINGEDIYLWLTASLNGSMAFKNIVAARIHKTEELSIDRRKKAIPYHIEFYSSKLDEVKEDQRKMLKKFLMKSMAIHWAAAKIEKNRWFRKQIRKKGLQISNLFYILLLTSEILPRQIFTLLKKGHI